jgi:hypothetical protein
MKFKIYSIITIAIVLFYSCNKSKEIKNDLEKDNLYGNAKSITEKTFFAVEKFGEIVKGDKYWYDFVSISEYDEWVFNSYVEFNNKGYIIKSFSFFKEVNDYNDKNQLRTKQYLSKDLKTASTVTYKYDNKGYLIESINNFSKDKTKYLNDKDGNCIELNQYDSIGNLFNKVKTNISFNKEGDRIEERKSYNDDGSFSFHLKTIFDKNGNEIESCSYDESGKIHQKINSKYNSQNLLIEYTEKLEYQKNVNEGWTKLIEHKYTKFDSNKNWTEKIEYKNGKPVEIIERKIVYFK